MVVKEQTSVHYAILVNTHAGIGNAGKVWPALHNHLQASGVSFTVFESQYPGHTTIWARSLTRTEQHTDPQTVILVIGGDGTLHQAVNGVQSALQDNPKLNPLPIAYVPSGSGNDFARAVKLPQDPIVALKQILAVRHPGFLDIGHYFDHRHQRSEFFTNNVGVGFDGRVVTTTNYSRVKRALNVIHLGGLAYPVHFFGALFKQRTFSVRIHSAQGTQRFSQACLVTATNHPFFGGGVAVAPTASMVDGKLDLVILEQTNIFQFFYLFALMVLFHNHLDQKHAHHLVADELDVTFGDAEFGQEDGEIMGRHTYDFSFDVHQQLFWLPLTDHEPNA
ncbi:MAG: diacylglycerol kinase family protein [Schleiferilactobacillus perolens]|uniref:diacylglycerol/lipid kinase family protein n=1 Tax=Schleiferilactobacillus perolens TaxID=100468 RepID=UPI0039EA306E